MCRSGHSKGPSGQPVGVNASRHIWSSVTVPRFKSTDHAQPHARPRTFIELQTQLVLNEQLLGEVVLMKLGSDDVPKWRRASQRIGLSIQSHGR